MKLEISKKLVVAALALAASAAMATVAGTKSYWNGNQLVMADKLSATSNGGRDTLSAGTKTEAVTSGASCVCSSETANAVRCSVATTTLTVTGTGTDAFNYWCNK